MRVSNRRRQKKKKQVSRWMPPGFRYRRFCVRRPPRWVYFIYYYTCSKRLSKFSTDAHKLTTAITVLRKYLARAYWYDPAPGVEKKVSSEQLEQDTRQAPHVRARIVPHASDHLSGMQVGIIVRLRWPLRLGSHTQPARTYVSSIREEFRYDRTHGK